MNMKGIYSEKETDHVHCYQACCQNISLELADYSIFQ